MTTTMFELPDADLTALPPPWQPVDRPSISLPGGTRSAIVEETIAKVRPHFDRLGVEYERIDVNESLGVPIYWAYQRQKFERGYGQREWNFGGKGATEQLALASMLMECLERVYGSRIHHPEMVRARWETIVDRGAVDPDTLAIPKTFDRTKLHEWGYARSLMTGEAKLVHANFLLTPYDAIVGDTLFKAEFNGLASGNNVEEAVLHGLYELIERDAWVLAHGENLANVRVIDRETIDDPRSLSILTALERRAAHVVLLDLTRDGLPASTIGVLAFDDGFLGVPIAPIASGTSYDPTIALSRALTELCQWRANLIFIKDELPTKTSRARNLARAAAFFEGRGLQVRKISFVDLGQPEPASIHAQLERTLTALGALGIDVLMAKIASVPGVLEVVKLVTGGLQALTEGLDYLDGGETASMFSRRTTARLKAVRFI